jgi:hypothetical protein
MEYVVMLALEFGDGETDVRPTPTPRRPSTVAGALATRLPPKIAVEERAETEGGSHGRIGRLIVTSRNARR